ncbi:MAG: hypothetical protein CSA20_04235 [Deltaproteobacteria bacterium]|nr:MAG: hypothetical protein CSA20_04235 [Deltaproteobacteria bacterium]
MLEPKLGFVTEWRLGNFTLSELCREFEVSCPTAYTSSNTINWEGVEGCLKKQKTSFPSPQNIIS